jgi:hypothetical protein
MLRKLVSWLFKARLKKYEAEIVLKLDEKIKRATELIEQANIEKLKAERRNFTVLERCEVDSEHFLRTLKEVSENLHFQYELFIIKSKIESLIIDGKNEAAILGQGMLKGLDLLANSLQTAALKYKAIQDEKNAKVQSKGSQEEIY